MLLSVDLAATDIVVTNTSGAFGAQIAEHALALMFALARRLPGALRSQASRRYAPEPRDELFELAGQTLGIVGFGDVGQALARRARGIGMRVIAMRRRPRDAPEAHALIPELPLDPLADSDPDDPSALADEVLGPDRLDDLLRDSDVVVNAAPLTPATVRLFGPEQFARMRPTACFINVGRGETVDQDALIDALRNGVIAAAGLDVTTPRAAAAGLPALVAAQHHSHRPLRRLVRHHARPHLRDLRGQPPPLRPRRAPPQPSRPARRVLIARSEYRSNTPYQHTAPS